MTNTSRGINFVAHSDQGGRSDGVQVMVHNDYAYIGHNFSGGFTVLDVRDPKNPKHAAFVPAPENTRCLHLQTHEDLLLVVNGLDPLKPSEARESGNYAAGLRIFDISQPARPKEIGFMPVEGTGLHRIWYVGGRYAYVSANLDGYSDTILMVVDVSDPTRPAEVARWWLPGMWNAGGEEQTWEGNRRFALHHAIVADGIAFASWRDGGLTLLDVSSPTSPSLLAHRNWSPPFGGGTHTAVPLLDRGLCIVLDEAMGDECADQVKYTWVVDVREPSNPVNIATMPTPSEDDYCKKGGRFGPHNAHENRPGSFQSSEIVFATYQNAGVRAFNIADPFHPKEVAYYVPPAPERMVDPRPARPQVIQSADVFVDSNGLMYVTDTNAGLYILEYKGK